MRSIVSVIPGVVVAGAMLCLSGVSLAGDGADVSQPDTPPVTGQVSDFTCDQLWFSRNRIFKEGGYCFKTARAIAAFGNAGCRFDDGGAVPLSQENRNLIQQIQAAERAKSCPR